MKILSFLLETNIIRPYYRNEGKQLHWLERFVLNSINITLSNYVCLQMAMNNNNNIIIISATCLVLMLLLIPLASCSTKNKQVDLSFLILLLILLTLLIFCGVSCWNIFLGFSQIYVVEFRDKTTPQHEEIENTHHSYLLSVKGTREEAQASLLYSYKHTINGFAAFLTPKEANIFSGKIITI